MIPRYHKFITEAANHVSAACCEIEQAYFDDKDPECKKLHDALSKLNKRLFNKWAKSCKRGKKEGWLNGGAK